MNSCAPFRWNIESKWVRYFWILFSGKMVTAEADNAIGSFGSAWVSRFVFRWKKKKKKKIYKFLLVLDFVLGLRELGCWWCCVEFWNGQKLFLILKHVVDNLVKQLQINYLTIQYIFFIFSKIFYRFKIFQKSLFFLLFWLHYW